MSKKVIAKLLTGKLEYVNLPKPFWQNYEGDTYTKDTTLQAIYFGEKSDRFFKVFTRLCVISPSGISVFMRLGPTNAEKMR